MDCRPHCAACCIAPSISSLAKPAGVPCSHLDEALRCRLFGKAERPHVCTSLRPSMEMCGSTREHAMIWLQTLETSTLPTIS